MVEGGRFLHPFTVSVETDSAIHRISLRWAMNRRSTHPRNWSMALIMANVRIDGVDFEERVDDYRGHRCSGWHRHIWDTDTESCERCKECLSDFGPFNLFPEFVLAASTVLGIEFEEEEERDAVPSLPFD